MKNYEIYLITNIVNSKIYIGLSTRGGKFCYFSHISNAKCNSNLPIHRAIRKWGMRNFELKILASTESFEELKELEIKYIKEYNSNNLNFGYNLTKGGDGSKGIIRSLDTKLKISKTKKEQNIKGSAAPFYGKKHSEEFKSIIKNTIRTHPNCSKPIKIKTNDFENNTVLHFESILECSKVLNISKSSIRYCIKNNSLYKNKLKFEKEFV